MLKVVIWTVVILVFILYEFYENLHLDESHYNIKSEDVPLGFMNKRFLVLADLHNNSYGEGNIKLLNRINKINPDFIIVAGDMIVSKKPVDYSVAFNLLSKLAVRYPIFYSYGNHEQYVIINHELSNEQSKELFNNYRNDLSKLGVHFLVNESIRITHMDETIVITGLLIGPEYFKKLSQPEMKTEYLQKLVGISDKKCYNILIAHNPVYFKNYLEWGADLIVSGHLHGGIIRLPKIGGVISPQYKFFPKYDAGQFNEGGKTMLVSRGLGMHTIKIRVCNRPELMVVNLKR